MQVCTYTSTTKTLAHSQALTKSTKALIHTLIQALAKAREHIFIVNLKTHTFVETIATGSLMLLISSSYVEKLNKSS